MPDEHTGTAALPRTIVFVDQPNVELLEIKHQVRMTPDKLMRLAKCRGTITDAFVFADIRIDRDPRDWEYAGFQIIACRRYTRAHVENGEAATKESVDATFIQRVLRESEKTHLEHVILVVGDSDYSNLVQTLLAKETAVTVFLTERCEFSNPKLRTRLKETLALWQASNGASDSLSLEIMSKTGIADNCATC